MTISERYSIIEQLHLVTGYSRKYFEKMTDEQLQQELNIHFG